MTLVLRSGCEVGISISALQKGGRMAVSPQEVREMLLARDSDFQRLAQEHSLYENQLDQLSRQTYLNSEDLLHEIELKKRRLRVKDEMEILVARRRREYDNR
jgi:uncharacterized protein YdcH (DUF465 family)